MITDFVLLLTFLFLAAVGLRHPPVAYTGYLWTELMAPQRIAVGELSSMPLSMTMAMVCVVALLTQKGKQERDMHVTLAVLISLFLIWFVLTTQWATNPTAAAWKLSWAWRSIAFTIIAFFIVRTRLSFELFLFTIIVCVGYFAISAGLKSIVGGGGYGKRLIHGGINHGLSESSTLGAMTVACVPLILYLVKSGKLLPRTRTVRLAGYATCVLFFAATIGTHSRTGLVCMGLLGLIALLFGRRRVLAATLASLGGYTMYRFAGDAWLDRMSTLSNAEDESSAAGRLVVWRWTLDYTRSHPFGAGFDGFRDNAGKLDAYIAAGSPSPGDSAIAYHSVYFEVLGEQGYPGFIIFLLILAVTVRLLVTARHVIPGDVENSTWISSAATACLLGLVILVIGAAFVGIAYRPYLYLFSVAAAFLAMERNFYAQRSVIALEESKLKSRFP